MGWYPAEDVPEIPDEEKRGDPGTYPFTRGIHKDMFRGRYWTRREVTGYGLPEESNKRLKFLIEEGSSGLNVIPDKPSILGIDSDHHQGGGEDEAGTP
jgi:methylmalonyl-CoA mutase N-terminal domain/subunit